MMPLRVSFFGVIVLVTLILKASCVHSEDLDTEYDYGDPSVQYDSLHNDPPSNTYDYEIRDKAQAVINGRMLPSKRKPRDGLPLCCPKGEVYDEVKCILPPTNFDWAPKLDGAHKASFFYNGFPKCETKKDFIQTYQREVHFSQIDAKLFLPYHIRLLPLERDEYCIAKVYDSTDSAPCESFQTKVFTCFSEAKESPAILWTSVGISHFFVFVTLLAYFFISELRCLQGQYMICFLISLLIYNIFLLPGSILPMDITDVSCIALGAVKYFFFCGIFLWFNVICFDSWRTLRNKQDISGRRRFLIYSAYSWTLGAVLTTVVLVLPYMKDEAGDDSRSDPLKDSNYDTCKLKLQMNMILQIAQFISLFIDLVFLIMASCSICSYSKFGNGLPRCEASLCLKQGWKLFIIMTFHVISCIDQDIVKLPIPLWLYVLLESAAIFGVFAYRRTILKKLLRHKMCGANCTPRNEDGSLQEKGQLTNA